MPAEREREKGIEREGERDASEEKTANSNSRNRCVNRYLEERGKHVRSDAALSESRTALTRSFQHRGQLSIGAVLAAPWTAPLARQPPRLRLSQLNSVGRLGLGAVRGAESRTASPPPLNAEVSLQSAQQCGAARLGSVRELSSVLKHRWKPCGKKEAQLKRLSFSF